MRNIFLAILIGIFWAKKMFLFNMLQIKEEIQEFLPPLQTQYMFFITTIFNWSQAIKQLFN